MPRWFNLTAPGRVVATTTRQTMRLMRKRQRRV
jgi:hypothetical protein